jgi:glycosyltransferase involved in cell wall biosynthesis
MEARACNSSPPRNRISVALCTFNGEQFLPKQLASIEKQTRLPDEVVICDDRSSDGTVGILLDFAASAPFPVKVQVNEENLGVARNFEKAILACTGDLIALSDQDDIWHQTRLERSEQVLLAHPEVELVFSDADIIDNEDQPTGARLWQSFQFAEKEMQSLLLGEYEICVKRRFVTGATAMFRASLRNYCLPIGPGWLHDEWITAIAAVLGDLRAIDESLISYRKHASQQLGPNRRPSVREIANQRLALISGGAKAAKYWSQLVKEAKLLKVLCDVLSELPLKNQERERFAAYQSYLRFLFFRADLPDSRFARLFPVLSNWSGYSRHFRGWKSAMRDLFASR